jgi:transcriptional regulator with XRE-family HTH domain
MDLDRESFLKEVGRRLADARKVSGINQTDLGRMIGKSQDAISHYESGARELSISDLVLLSDALKLPTSYLLNEGAIAEEIATADRILAPALGVAAKMTLYRYLKLQILLVHKVHELVKGYNSELNIGSLERILYSLRDELLIKIENYRDTIAEYYARLHDIHPDRDPFEAEFDISAFLADDVRQFFEQNHLRRKSPNGESDSQQQGGY